MVDAVLSFEGERGYPFRILRGAKNRFGATDEIGVFEMGDAGLREVANPSALFLERRRRARRRGAAVFAGIEGSRPVLVEFQALVAPSAYGTPRRAVVGWDTGRLAMVLAVLEARCGLASATSDVYLNVAGGLRITEPAADLAAAAALASSALDEASAPGLRGVRRDQPVGRGVRPVSRMGLAPEGSRQAGLSARRSGAQPLGRRAGPVKADAPSTPAWPTRCGRICEQPLDLR